MKRRQFLQLGAVGTAAALVLPATRGFAADTKTSFSLVIKPATASMIDGTDVYVLVYCLDGLAAQPELRVTEGDAITVSVTNNDSAAHGFAIPGIPSAFIAMIEPGTTATVTFAAPGGGSYLYVDPYKAPLNRVLGLHGAFIVEPIDGNTMAGSPTPFSRLEQTPQVEAFCDALGGGSERFPGEKWDPSDPDREKLWLFSQTDPSLNARIRAGESVNPASVVANFLPRYFTVNGLSGYDTAVHGSGHGAGNSPAARIMPSGKQGQPCLIRTMNAGLATHSVHIHGNHCMICAETDAYGGNQRETHVYERDSWLLAPLARIDVILPFERPPDIPKGKWPPRDEAFPLRYVMHCHTEMSQTAGGGNYPQGAVTHWQMTGAL
ncbi:MAG: multicopper oxidase domain-containing protein [Sphingomonas bacterium]|nr:multicopper oxidase domain-containing protein [Sphingomonas bacterium]